MDIELAGKCVCVIFTSVCSGLYFVYIFFWQTFGNTPVVYEGRRHHTQTGKIWIWSARDNCHRAWSVFLNDLILLSWCPHNHPKGGHWVFLFRFTGISTFLFIRIHFKITVLTLDDTNDIMHFVGTSLSWLVAFWREKKNCLCVHKFHRIHTLHSD